ncbi:hypothetical protein FB45DRAFT_1061796, partial [Roridomyces roridus]
MPSLERQLSRPSIYSWWSDSNPMLRSGPTINIHAMAKPLMRRMYHRQALAFIARDGHAQPCELSAAAVEIYSSYLSYKYIAPETRLRVLQHLGASAVSHCNTARAITRSSAMTSLIPWMLDDQELRMTAYLLVAALMAHSLKLLLPPEWVANRIETTWIHRGETDERTFILATAALHTISDDSVGTGIFAALFHSEVTCVRLWACALVRELASYWFALPSLIGCVPLEMLFELAIRDPDGKVSAEAIRALDQLARHPDNAAAIVATKMLDTMWDSAELASGACTLICTLISQQYSVYSLLREDSILKMLHFLRSESDINTTIQLLSAAAEHPTGSAAILAMDWPSRIPDFLLANATYIKHRTCVLIQTLVQHEPLIAVHLWEDSIKRMLNVLSDGDTETGQAIFESPSCNYGYQAMSALAEIAQYSQGARTLCATETSRRIPAFLESKNIFIKREAHNLVENLAEQGLITGTVLGRSVIERLGKIIKQEDNYAAFEAVWALSKIAWNAHVTSRKGSQSCHSTSE